MDWICMVSFMDFGICICLLDGNVSIKISSTVHLNDHVMIKIFG